MPQIINELLLLLVWLVLAISFTLAIFGSTFVFVVDVWIKKKTRGATLMVFFDTNREESYDLIKLSGDESFVREYTTSEGKEDEVRYVVDPSRQMARYWPPALPQFLQVKMATYYYMVGHAAPIDPLGGSNLRLLSPRMLARLVNENLLTGLIREAREAVGLVSQIGKIPLITLVLIGVMLVMFVIMFLMMNNISGNVSELNQIITQTG